MNSFRDTSTQNVSTTKGDVNEKWDVSSPVRKHLILDASTALANALVSSRLEYCNSLLHSIPGDHLKKL